MKEECELAVAQAAGRSLTRAEIKDIEDRIVNAQKLMAQKDPKKYASMDRDTRLREAAKLAAEQLSAEAAKKKQRVAKTILAHDRIENYLVRMKQKFPGMDGLEALRRKLAFHADMKNTDTSVEYAAKAIEYDAVREMQTALEGVGPRVFGLLTNKDGIRAFLYELYGRDSSKIMPPEAAKMAKNAAAEWNVVAERLRSMFNAEGGEIGKLEDWRIAQSHSDTLILKTGRDQWVADTLPAMDRNRYVHEDGTLLTDSEMVKFLKEAWLTLATGGANKLDKSPGYPGMRARRHAEHRSLHFKGADEYLSYMDKYGHHDPYSAMIQHIGRMAKDIALIREFGPNPDAMFDYWKNKIVAETVRENPKLGKKLANRKMQSTTGLYDYIAGRTLPVANEWLSNGFDTLRNWLVATRMGSAVISSIPDSATMHLTAKVNNMSSIALFRNQLKTLKPRNAEDRRILHRAGLGMDTFIGQVNRYGADSFGPTFSAQAARFTTRISALNAVTEARRRSFAVTMYGSIGSVTRRYKSLNDLEAMDRRILESKGVTDTDFQVWKRAELEDWRGNEMLTPDVIYAIPDESLSDLGDPARLKEGAVLKLLAHVLEETDMAVIVPGAAERAALMGGLQKGTWKGELFRSLWVFKGFPISVVAKHFSRAFAMKLPVGRAAYIAAFMAGTTLLGAASTQIYELINGRDPLDMTKGRFWGRAMLKGGSMGVYGDFLFQTNSSYGSTPLAMLAGPVAGDMEDFINLTQGNLVQLAQGKRTNAGAEAMHFLKGHIPLQNLWYTRAVTDRLFFQQLQEIVSPGYNRRMDRRAQKYGQSNWWKPGQTIPARGPDWDRAVGQ